MLETSVENRLIAKVRECGGEAYKLISIGQNGIPDRLVVLPDGRIYFVETKRPKGGVYSKLQKFQQKKLKGFNCNVICLKNYDEVDKFIKEVVSNGIHTT